MMDTFPPPDHLSGWVGRQETREDIASRASAIGLRAVLDTHVSSDESDSAELFPLGHWLQFTPTAPMSELGADGHPKLGGFLPPLPLPRRMWAGSSITYHEPITVGQHLTRTTTIERITPKKGTSGQLCFIVLRHNVKAEGVLALTERQTLVYREAVEINPAASPTARPPREDSTAPHGWDWEVARRPDEATLFRYSALTFNTHRIHYDHPYATGVEGYPGLVVHGPLVATYLMDSFLQNRPGAVPTKFEFSASAPSFARELLRMVGRADGEGSEDLAIIGPDGLPTVTARIEYR